MIKDEKAVALVELMSLDFSRARQIPMNELLKAMRIIFTSKMYRYARDFLNRHLDAVVVPEASFAGQQEIFLNIRGNDTFLDAVKKCWASFWTARAIAYRIKNNIDQNTVALAVVVQEVAYVAAAGILFTANPINGKRDKAKNARRQGVHSKRFDGSRRIKEPRHEN